MWTLTLLGYDWCDYINAQLVVIWMNCKLIEIVPSYIFIKLNISSYWKHFLQSEVTWAEGLGHTSNINIFIRRM